MTNFDKQNVAVMGDTQMQSEFTSNETFNVNVHVLDNEEFESASDEEGVDRIRKIHLKQIRKENQPKDGVVHKHFFFVGQQFGIAIEVKERVHQHSIETRRELYLKKNDK